MSKSQWYDKFAPVYDAATIDDFFYRKPREAAIKRLQLTDGCGVADVFCGTGVALPRLIDAVGEEGIVLAMDGSKKMLERAKVRAETLGMDTNIHFLQADFSHPVGIAAVKEAIAKKRPGHIIFSLGLTCLENWREFLSAVFEASPPGTRFAIMDIYQERLTLGARILSWIGAADCRRPVWEVLEEKSVSFEWQEFRPFKVLDVSVIVASGEKP